MTQPTKLTACCGGCDENGTKPKCGMCGVQQEIELTDAEIAQLETDAVTFAAEQAQRVAAATALAALKASAKAKLVAGEPLTEAEAATLVI